MTEITLRPYQTECSGQLRQGIREGHRKQVLMAPAGAGKTEIAASIIQEAHRKGSRAVFLVDRIVLCDQTSERFDRYNIPHGVLQSGHWRYRPYERIQVCSAQTLEKRGFPGMDLLIVDEAHCLRKQVSEMVQATDAVVIGLTATPFAKGMGKLYSNLVNVTTTNRLIEEGFLCPVKAYAAKAIDMTGAKVVAGEWAESEIQKRGTEILGDIVAEWVDKTRLHFGGPVKTIVFAANVEHGNEIVQRFQAAGYNFHQISYRDTNADERKGLIEEFRKTDSSIHGLVSCEIFTKGFDVPDILCGISARPYRKSLSSHIQQLGRVMRPAAAKTFGLWLDHAGNYLRFQRDTDEIFENGMQALDDGEHDRKVREEPKEKDKSELVCGCGYVLAPHQKTCPGCGREIKRRNLIETLPGEMVEVGAASDETIPQWMRKRSDVWAQLCTFAAMRKPSQDDALRLARAKYKSWYGTWPPFPFTPGAPVSMEAHRRIKHDAIKWAKGQEAARRAA